MMKCKNCGHRIEIYPREEWALDRKWMHIVEGEGYYAIDCGDAGNCGCNCTKPYPKENVRK